ncbi:hypothetical protein OC835_007611, partial [Tilletia horrida]
MSSAFPPISRARTTSTSSSSSTSPDIITARLDPVDRPFAKIDLLLLKDNHPRIFSTSLVNVLISSCASADDLYAAEDAAMAGLSTLSARRPAVQQGDRIKY